MSVDVPEPGFIQAYRLFVVIRILFWLAVGPVLILIELAGNAELTTDQVMGNTLIQQLSFPRVAPLLGLDVVLLALLLWPAVARRLRKGFVPVTIGLGLVPLLVGYYRWPAENPLQSPFAMFFFVTALLVAWEYKYHSVFLYVFALSSYEALVSHWPARLPWSVPLGWLVLQGVMMMLAGYVTATLVSVQREQRSALAEAYRRQAEINERLQRHAATLEELAISRERNRLARELHDTLAHSLSAVTVQLEAIRSLWHIQPEKARRILEQADETARTGLGEARRALRALRAAPLEDLGLVLAVRELAEAAAQRCGAELALHLPEGPAEGIALGSEQGIYRIAQETLENIVNHACARKVSVSLEQAPDHVTLTIQDDGLGIDFAALPEEGEPGGERLGIRGMQERAHLIGGELEISSEAGGGTRVKLTVPDGGQRHGAGAHL